MTTKIITQVKRKIKIYYNGTVQGNTIIKKLEAQLADNSDYDKGLICVNKAYDDDGSYICVTVFSKAKRIPELMI